MKNWVSLLILVSFVRLQFICCCGPIAHGIVEPTIVGIVSADSECCVTIVEPKCRCNQHAAEKPSAQALSSSQNSSHATPSWVGSAEAADGCECKLCKHRLAHLPHLFLAQRVRVASQSQLPLELFVVTHAWPSASLAELKRLDRSHRADPEAEAKSGVGILYQLGRLLI